MDYKELIDRSRSLNRRWGAYSNQELSRVLQTVTDALEETMAERDAAIADIERDCKTCIHYKSNTRGHIPCDVMDSCIFSDHWQWCGLQKHD